jgi:hypothetical protein
MAANKTSWKNFFLSSLKSNKPLNANNLYVNARRMHQKGGQSNEPIKLITPTMQVTEQARQSLQNATKRKRSYRKQGTRKTTKGNPKKKTKGKPKKKTTKGKPKKKKTSKRTKQKKKK